MPFGDGTGPFGKGPMTGRRGGGMGRGRGLGRGFGRGLGRGLGRRRFAAVGAYPGTDMPSANSQLLPEQEEVANKIYEVLPKIDCGACGYSTCRDCAKAIASGKAPYNACRVLRTDGHEKIKKILEGR